MRRLCLAVGSLLLLAGCRSAPIIPEGPQMVSGLLERAPLSPSRRGTHMLQEEGETVYFVESRVLNLRPHEGAEVTLEGIVEANIDPLDTPVLVVTKLLKSSGSTLKQTRLSHLGISLDAPVTWQLQQKGDEAEFREAGSAEALLTISSAEQRSLPFDMRTLAVRSGSGINLDLTPFLVHVHRAVRAVDPSTSRTMIYVEKPQPVGTLPGSGSVLTFRFADGQEEENLDAEMIDSILQSVRFTQTPPPPRSAGSSAVSSGAASSLDPAGEGRPCGGPAGILCPSGYYCEVTDRLTDTGNCKRR